MTIALPPQGAIDDAIRRALAEDLGDAGDLTSAAIIPADLQSRAVIAARKAGVMAGLPIAAQVFRTIDPTLVVKLRAADGDAVAANTTVMEISRRRPQHHHRRTRRSQFPRPSFRRGDLNCRDRQSYRSHQRAGLLHAENHTRFARS